MLLNISIWARAHHTHKTIKPNNQIPWGWRTFSHFHFRFKRSPHTKWIGAPTATATATAPPQHRLTLERQRENTQRKIKRYRCQHFQKHKYQMFYCIGRISHTGWLFTSFHFILLIFFSKFGYAFVVLVFDFSPMNVILIAAEKTQNDCLNIRISEC